MVTHTFRVRCEKSPQLENFTLMLNIGVCDYYEVYMCISSFYWSLSRSFRDCLVGVLLHCTQCSSMLQLVYLLNLLIFTRARSIDDDYWSDDFDENKNCAHEEKIEQLRNKVMQQNKQTTRCKSQNRIFV